MMTRGHLLASTQSPMYRVCFTSFQYCGVNPWSVEFTSCMSVTVTAMVQSAVTKLLHILAYKLSLILVNPHSNGQKSSKN